MNGTVCEQQPLGQGIPKASRISRSRPLVLPLTDRSYWLVTPLVA
jgi:hypothetical protein